MEEYQKTNRFWQFIYYSKAELRTKRLSFSIHFKRNVNYFTSFTIPEVPEWVISVETAPFTKVDLVLLLSPDVLSALVWVRIFFVPF